MAHNRNFEIIRRIIEIRYVVGFLGEKSQCNWWPSSFYESSSISFLEPVFCRTTSLAQYHGVVEAARRFHDENLNVGSYHIFRLPEEMEQDLHDMVQTGSDEIFDAGVIFDQATALSTLAQFGNVRSGGAVGPVKVGRVEELGDTVLLEKICEIYQLAMSSHTHALPYLVQ